MVKLVTLLFLYGITVISDAETIKSSPCAPTLDKPLETYESPAAGTEVEQRLLTLFSFHISRPTTSLSGLRLDESTNLDGKSIRVPKTNLLSKTSKTEPYVSNFIDYEIDNSFNSYVTNPTNPTIFIPNDLEEVFQRNEKLFNKMDSITLASESKSYDNEIQFYLPNISNLRSPLVTRLSKTFPLNNVEQSIYTFLIPAPPEFSPLQPFRNPSQVNNKQPSHQYTPFTASNNSENLEFVEEPVAVSPHPESPQLQPAKFPSHATNESSSFLFPGAVVSTSPTTPGFVENSDFKNTLEAITVPLPPELPPFQPPIFLSHTNDEQPFTVPVIPATPEFVENADSKNISEPILVPEPPKFPPFQSPQILSQIVDKQSLTHYPFNTLPITPNVEFVYIKDPNNIFEPIVAPTAPEFSQFQPAKFPLQVNNEQMSFSYPPTAIPVVPTGNEIVENKDAKKVLEPVLIPPKFAQFQPHTIPSQAINYNPSFPCPSTTEYDLSSKPEFVHTTDSKNIMETIIMPQPPAFPHQSQIYDEQPSFAYPAATLPTIPIVPQFSENVDSTNILEPIVISPPPELSLFQPFEISSKVIDKHKLFPTVPTTPSIPEFIHATNSNDILGPTIVSSSTEISSFESPYFQSQANDKYPSFPSALASETMIPAAPAFVENTSSKNIEFTIIPPPPELPPFKSPHFPLQVADEQPQFPCPPGTISGIPITFSALFNPHPPASLPIIPSTPTSAAIPVIPPAPQIIETRHHKVTSV